MMSFRRALIFTVFFIGAIIVLRRAHTADLSAPIPQPDTSRHPPSGSDATAAGSDPVPAQKVIHDMSQMSLYDKLAYQYPYDVETKFPAYIWQTWKYGPDDAEFRFRDGEASWTKNHPGFIHEVITDKVAGHLLKVLYAPVPEVLEAYDAMPKPVLKADFFRYLILLARGGIYSDIDTFSLKSALNWLPEAVPKESVGLVVGIEADPDRPDWHDWYSRRIQFCQWTIQSKPGHPILRDIVSRITLEALKRKREGLFVSKEKSIVEFTGPAIWTDTIFDYFNDARYFETSHSQENITYKNFTGMSKPRKVGDVVVLPITSFSPGVNQMGAGDYDDPLAFVKHDFEGTIPEHLASVVAAHGDRPAVVARSPTTTTTTASTTKAPHRPPPPRTVTLSYAALDALSGTLAHSLRSLGVKKGDRVAVSLGNVAENVALSYALFKLGAVLVPLNPAFNQLQLAAALRHLGVELLVIGAVQDVAYHACRGRSNLPLLQSLIPDLLRQGGGGSGGQRRGRVESPSVPTLRTVVLVDNTADHPHLAGGFPTPAAESLGSSRLVPYAELAPPCSDFVDDGASGSLLSASRPVVPDAPLRPEEAVNIQFTSGTTSFPKAAMLSHTNILNNGYLIASRMGLVPSDKMVVPPPLFHCFGCVLGLMATSTTGAAILFPSPAFDPAATLHMVAEHRATGLYGVPTMFIAELELLSNPDFAKTLPPGGLDNLRTGIAAGSSIPASLMARLIETLNLHGLVICYGMTETSPVSIMTAPDDPLERRTASVGRVMPHTRIKVVARGDRSRVLPRGERGELAVSGYLLMQGYYGDRAQTAKDLVVEADGSTWMYTGDEACIDSSGYVEITGRIKDLIIRGGENVHPLEIENCLMQHPQVRDASVVGVPDAKYGEAIGAFVILNRGVQQQQQQQQQPKQRQKDADKATTTTTAAAAVDDDRTMIATEQETSEAARLDDDKLPLEEDLRRWVREALSPHLAPRHIWFLDQFPKTASGKIQKHKLREAVLDDERAAGS
ncbi:hypothetical protein GGR56DRAFT_665857 [Xylariaceae sp. FL0804]|nr:hypothetical protein GGR56DRAFT_665857 [Xylariaceae sp. FL0804]